MWQIQSQKHIIHNHSINCGVNSSFLIFFTMTTWHQVLNWIASSKQTIHALLLANKTQWTVYSDQPYCHHLTHKLPLFVHIWGIVPLKYLPHSDFSASRSKRMENINICTFLLAWEALLVSIFSCLASQRVFNTWFSSQRGLRTGI